MKGGVAGLFILTLLKTIQSLYANSLRYFRSDDGVSAINWINLILYGQDPQGTIPLQRNWYIIVNIPFVRERRHVPRPLS